MNAELEGYKPIDYSGMPHGLGEASWDLYQGEAAWVFLINCIKQININIGEVRKSTSPFRIFKT